MTREEFKNVFDIHFNHVRNYLYYRCGDQEMATDVAQETFIRLWEKNSEIVVDNLKGLLYKMAGDLLITHIRKRNVMLRYKSKPVEEQFNESPHDEMRYKELLMNYEKALEALPEKQRTVFLLSRMDGMKYNDIAENLGLSVKAVEKRMKLALQHLRHVIGENRDN
ncbi:MAG: sigma-70 family RNA polymerase sigma factor [Bacteroidia bacterium]|nr:sigma-70 family RNA polymerase sigma factor [Bacteroidia bacterium]